MKDSSKEASATSPFAAMTKQEQRHQWNVWHAQQNATRPVEEASQIPSVRALPEEKSAAAQETGDAKRESPQPARTAPASRVQSTTSAQTTRASRQPNQMPHHGQYQAVLKRMRQAGSHTGTFAPTATKRETAAFVTMTATPDRAAVPLQPQSAMGAEVESTAQPSSGKE